jgi:hypothetical protein
VFTSLEYSFKRVEQSDSNCLNKAMIDIDAIAAVAAQRERLTADRPEIRRRRRRRTIDERRTPRLRRRP